jgi:hypothetical protein
VPTLSQSRSHIPRRRLARCGIADILPR